MVWRIPCRSGLSQVRRLETLNIKCFETLTEIEIHILPGKVSEKVSRLRWHSAVEVSGLSEPSFNANLAVSPEM